jgi:hypothetical protein
MSPHPPGGYILPTPTASGLNLKTGISDFLKFNKLNTYVFLDLHDRVGRTKITPSSTYIKQSLWSIL